MTTKKTSSILGLLFSVSLIAVILFAVLNLKQVKAYSQTKFNQYFTFSLCDQPLPYKIGSIDPRFNLTKEKLLTDISKAENIWENEYDGELFEYDSTNKESSLTINLVYDKRTSLNTEINSLQNEVKQKDKNLKSDIDAYKSQVEAYKKRLDEFNNNSDALYKEIQYWNERGGAPEEEYQKLTEKKDQLIKEHDYLKSETERLNQIADSLNLSTDEYNAGIDELNTTIDTFNQTLAEKPEEGVYSPATNTIDIYFVNNQNELIHTLAHEMGHALNILHNQNPNSIMYPKSTQKITLSADDITSLTETCSQRYLAVPFTDKILKLKSQVSDR